MEGEKEMEKKKYKLEQYNSLEEKSEFYENITYQSISELIEILENEKTNNSIFRGQLKMVEYTVLPILKIFSA